MSGRVPHSFGTDIRAGIDPDQFKKAARSHGADLRYWVSHGTVATIKAHGKYDFADENAVWMGPEGVQVDVRLEPLDVPVTCLYAGISAGDVTIMQPIHPGDIVLVEMPDGDLVTPVITKILHSASNPMPLDGGSPIFDNQRVLIYAKSVPIDIRTSGANGEPVQVLIEQDGTVTTKAKRINQGDFGLTEQEVVGTSYRTAENGLLDGLQIGIKAMRAAAVGPLAIFQPGLAAMDAAIDAFKQLAQSQKDFLSDTVYVKK